MRSHTGVLTALIAIIASGSAWADERPATVTLGVTPAYYVGDYGTTATTKIYYLPVWAKYKNGNLSLKVTVPYIAVESAGALVSGGSVIAGGAGKTVTRNSGLGDIWTEAKYRFRGAGAAPDVSPYLKIKLGTASRTNRLGTGKNDFEPGVALDWVVGRTLFPFLQFGYRMVGSPTGYNLRDVATYEGGLTYQVVEKNFVTAMFSGHQATQAGFANTADLLVAWNYYVSPGSGFQVYVDKGLSNGSPNYGVGVGAQTRF